MNNTGKHPISIILDIAKVIRNQIVIADIFRCFFRTFIIVVSICCYIRWNSTRVEKITKQDNLSNLDTPII